MRSASRKPQPVSPQRGAILGRISPERKVDITGMAMVFLGLLTLLSLFSASRSGLTGKWDGLLAQAFGWGAYLLPVVLIVLGAWLVARNVERLPALNIERIVGIVLLFIGLLVAFHGLSGPVGSAYDRAAAGEGGGYLGALFQKLLVGGIGGLATAVLVVCWLLVALAMTLDLSMQEMFRWTGPLWKRLMERLNRRLAKPAAPAAAGTPPEPPAPPDDFQPLPRPALVSQTASATPAPGVTVRTGVPSAPVIAWSLPKVDGILEKPQAVADAIGQLG